MSNIGAVLTFDDLKLDLKHHRVWRGPQAISLPGLSFRLLEVLVRHSPEPVSRRKLVHEVWGDVLVSDETVRQRVRLLRQALGNPAYVATIKGVGYQLSAPVSKKMHVAQRRWPWVTALALGMLLATLVGAAVWPDLYHQVNHAIKHP